MRVHYPRTAHLPWSPGATSDDVRAGDLSGLHGREVVVTEKLDGENTTLYSDGLHARSLDSAHHPSRAWVKALQGRIGPLIPDGRRICGENMYARHSLDYRSLESWFYGFSVWDAECCLDWDATVRFLRGLGIPTPPVLWRGVFDEKALRNLRLDPGTQEGYVVRTVAGFDQSEFTGRVAKWVRPNHVQTDVHWMQAAVVPNGLGPKAALWDVRSGADVGAEELWRAAGWHEPQHDQDQVQEHGKDQQQGQGPTPSIGMSESRQDVLAEALATLDVSHRLGDVRLATALAATLHDRRRSTVSSRLGAGSLGMPLARRVADLIGLHGRLHTPFPDELRRSGLARMSLAVDLAALHAVSGAVLTGRKSADAREHVQWSALFAEDSGLSEPEPWRRLRDGLRTELATLPRETADRCWAAAREGWVEGKVASAEEAVAATWRLRDGRFSRLVQFVGPSGSGKSTFAADLADVASVVSMDDLRESRGSRADQSANSDVLGLALHRLESSLRTHGSSGQVIWDATSLNRQQRGLVLRRADKAAARVTLAVFLVDEPELLRRNAVRANPVPEHVLTHQLHRFQPPYPGESHRIWYIGAEGTVADIDGDFYRDGECDAY